MLSSPLRSGRMSSYIAGFMVIGFLLITSHTTADVQGAYIGAGYYSDPWTNLVSIDFDGNGTASYYDIATSDNYHQSGSVPYSVSAEGRFTNNGDLTGIVSPDTGFLVWVDTDHSDGSIGLYLAAKKSSGKSNANLNGDYLGIGYYSDPWTNRVSANFDGSGTVYYNDIATSDDNNESGSPTLFHSSRRNDNLKTKSIGNHKPGCEYRRMDGYGLFRQLYRPLCGARSCRLKTHMMISRATILMTNYGMIMVVRCFLNQKACGSPVRRQMQHTVIWIRPIHFAGILFSILIKEAFQSQPRSFLVISPIFRSKSHPQQISIMKFTLYISVATTLMMHHRALVLHRRACATWTRAGSPL